MVFVGLRGRSSCSSSSSAAAIAPFRKNGEDIFSTAVSTSAFDNKQYNNE